MTTLRVAQEFVESAATVGTTARVAQEFVESAGIPTTKLRVAQVFVEVAVGGPAIAPPLALRRRPDDNVTGSPILPRYHGTPQRSSALGAGTSW